MSMGHIRRAVSRCTAGSRTALAVWAVAAFGVAGWAGSAAAAGFDEHRAFEARELRLANLIGEVRIEGTDGPRFEVEVAVQGADANRERVRIETREGDRAELVVRFPVEEKSRFVYPRMGRGSSTTFRAGDLFDEEDGLLDSILGALGARQVRVSGKGPGLEIWADVTIKVPRQARCRVELGVGEVTAEGVSAELTCAARSGSITARDLEGDFAADTGSGSVCVKDARGGVSVDTGSGSVELRACRGSRIEVDTGSGEVTVEDIECERLSIDTGSGGVEARGVRADAVAVDTGSGSVVLRLDRMGKGRFTVDTGSGSIRLALPADASAEVMAETGSGGIDVDVRGVASIYRDHDEVAFRVGEGDAEVQLETGSGSIRVSR